MTIDRIAVPAIALMLIAGTASPPSGGGGARSRIIRLEPDAGRPGDLITAFGEQLDQARIEDLCLSDGQRTAIVKIVHQTEVSIQFRIPAKLQSGRYVVALLPVGACGRSVEQQVILTVL